jgi:hypothetical protein
MPNQSATLARFVPFYSVCDILRVQMPWLSPPVTIECPLCHTIQLDLFNDVPLRAEWGYCRGCKFSGDAIELAAQVWSLDIAATIQRLKSYGVQIPNRVSDPAAVTSYVENHVEYRRRMNDFWKQSSRDLPFFEPDSLTRMQRNILQRRDDSSWSDRARFTVGYTSINEVENLFHPKSVATTMRRNHGEKRTERPGSGAGKARVFKGNGTGGLSVLPFQDVPGRICGFLFVRDVRNPGPEDMVYKSVQLGPSNRRPKEAGLLMFNNCFSYYYSDVVDGMFIIADPLLAVRMQLKWLRTNVLPLPIVATFVAAHHCPRSVFRQSQVSDRVLWAPRIGPREVLQARFANARVSTYLATASEILDSPWVACFGLPNMKASTISWQDALRWQLNQLPLPAAEELLRDAALEPYAQRDFLGGCTKSLIEKLQPILMKPEFQPRIVISGRTIVERDGRWVLDPSGTEVCNAQLRIDRFIYTRLEKHYYEGRILLNGQEVPFRVDSAKADANFVKCLKEELPAASATLRSLPRCTRDLSAIAKWFTSSRAVVTNADVVGFLEDPPRFSFPKFALGMKGRIQEGSILTGPDDPAFHFEPPQPLSRHAVSQLSVRSRETRLFWAMAAGILHNVVAPLSSFKPVGIALVGTGAQAVCTQAAKLLGCHEFAIPHQRTTDRVLAQLQRACERHNWPLLLKPPTEKPSVSIRAWLNTGETKSCIVPLCDKLEAEAIINGWVVIRSERHFEGLHALEQIAPRVAPAYLMDVCQRRGCIGGLSPHPLHDVLRDLANWFASQGGDPKAVLRALHVLHSKSFQNPADKREFCWATRARVIG